MSSCLPPVLEFPGWTEADYAKALQDYKDNPPHLPTDTAEEIEKETVKFREALEKKLGLLDDFEKLFYNGFCTRHKLATLEQTDIKRLCLVGTLAQYKSVYAPAFNECSCESPDCELFGQFTQDNLCKRLDKVKRFQDWIEEKQQARCKKSKLQVHEQSACVGEIIECFCFCIKGALETEMCLHSVCQRVPGKRRVWTDPQMYTHVALIPGIVVASIREPPMLELVVLQGIVCVLSLIWHRRYEREDGFAKIEHLFAHGLFAYGLAQTFLSPGIWTLMANLTCACVTSTVYVVTYDNKALWEKWHAIGLHVVPGIWSVVIASMHECLLF